MNATETTERMTTQERREQLIVLGFALTIKSGPTGLVEPAKGRDAKEWPCIAFEVELHFRGKTILSTPYRLGIGHVDISKARPDSFASQWTDAEQSMIYTWQRNPHAQFKDKALQVQIAAKLAKRQKVEPELVDVLSSLLSDGLCFFNAQSFEDWASDFGYDTDSRHAEGIYRQCMETGRQLTAGVTKEALEEAGRILQDY